MNAQLNNEYIWYTCLGYSLSWDCYSSYSFLFVISLVWRCHESSADTDGRIAVRETSGWAAWTFGALILVIFTSLLISCLSLWGPDHHHRHHPSLTHTPTHTLSPTWLSVVFHPDLKWYMQLQLCSSLTHLLLSLGPRAKGQAHMSTLNPPLSTEAEPHVADIQDLDQISSNSDSKRIQESF